MRIDLVLILFFLGVSLSCKHHVSEKATNPKTMTDSVVNNFSPMLLNKALDKSAHFLQDEHIHTSKSYFDSGILIQNSYPKGGAYHDALGNNYGYGVFFTSVKNQMSHSVNMELKFSSLPIFGDSLKNAQVEIFLPNDTLILEKLNSFNYGVEDLSFFEDEDSTDKQLVRRIASDEQIYFFVAILFKNTGPGPVRTGLEMNGNNLFYKTNFLHKEEVLIVPCGKIDFIKSN